MNIAILGFGTVGYGVYELAQKTDDITVQYVLDIKKHDDITAKSVTDINEILNDNEVETVVELIGGKHPAYDFIKSALQSGKNVITANKLVICEYYEELTLLAKEMGVALRYTAAVGGGIPWLTNLERTVRTSSVYKIEGILNGTTNYILDAMHKNGTAFDVALKEAQRLGFAEADPSSDIDGLDTKRKIGLSSNIAFGVVTNPDEIDTIGISDITKEIIEDVESLGYVSRLIATSKNDNGNISCYVEPTLVQKTDAFATVDENFNRIEFNAENVGIGSYHGYGAGRYPTAYTVINDCIDVANGNKKTYNSKADKTSVNNTLDMHAYYCFIEDDDAWLDSKTYKKTNIGIITKPTKVREMHEFYNRMKRENKKVFVAGIK